MKILRPNFEKRGGLVDVVVQCSITRDVVMKAKTDEAGFLRTCVSGLATFFSESRNKPWVKGEESGNFLEVVDVQVDCDGDALIYIVIPKGNACHTGARSCFYRSVLGQPLGIPAPGAGEKEALPDIEIEVHERFVRLAMTGEPEPPQHQEWSLRLLEQRLRERAKAPATESYTRQLLNKGTARCAKKLGEESVEAVIAAVVESDERLIAECADVVYHLLVLLLSRDLSFSSVEEELQRRERRSGLQEKALRT